MKTCTRCKNQKPLEEFVKRSSTKDGHASYCKSCAAILHHQQWLNRTEDFCQKRKISRAKNYQKTRVKRLAMNKAWNKTHLKQMAAATSKWMKAHPEQVYKSVMRRKARKHNSPIIEDFSLDEIGMRDHCICHICHKKVLRKSATVDHLIPLIHGGSHTRENVALAHRSCNSRRGPGRLPAQLRLLG